MDIQQQEMLSGNSYDIEKEQLDGWMDIGRGQLGCV